MQLVWNSGKSVTEVAGDLDLTVSALRSWVKQAEVDQGKGPVGALTSVEREELSRLRKENRILKEEREILKKAALSSTCQGNTRAKDCAGDAKDSVLLGRWLRRRAMAFSSA